MQRIRQSILLFFGLILPLVAPLAQRIPCQVVAIADGDTLTCLYQKQALKVRLKHIDAPEKGQPYGQRAKQALAGLVFRKSVQLEIEGLDKYRRLLAVVFEGSRNINLLLVEQGMAWAYLHTTPLYLHAQEQERNQRLGLWQDIRPLSPSEWRAAKRASDGNRH